MFSRTTSTSNPAFRYENNGYDFTNKTHNPSLQLFTNFSNGNSNEFRISYNRLRDARDPREEAPNVTVDGFANGAGEDYQIQTGAEQFSQGNRLDQDILEFTDNFTFAPKGDHTITIGTRNEFYSLSNLFAQSSYGVYEFDILADFQSGGINDASAYIVSGNLSGGPVTAAEFSSAQFGLYAQDQWQVSPEFSLTIGLRVDIPVFFDQPTYGAQAVTDFDDPGVPSGQVLWNPRVGFNWDIDAQQTQQLRGGHRDVHGQPGLRVDVERVQQQRYGHRDPAVRSDQPQRLRTGVQRRSVRSDAELRGCGRQPDGRDRRRRLPRGDRPDRGRHQVPAGHARQPRVRPAPAQRLAPHARGDLQQGHQRLLHRQPEPRRGRIGQRFRDRSEYGPRVVRHAQHTGRSDPNYFRNDVYGTGSTGVFELRNTSENYSYNLTAGVQKFIGEDLRLTGAYTFSRSYDVQSFTSSRATSNWRFGRMNAGDQLVDNAQLSSFDRPHKVTMSGTYQLPWHNWPTQISLIYIGYSGLARTPTSPAARADGAT